MTTPARILYCHCAHARVLPPDVKAGVLERRAGAGGEFEAVPDLCEMAARGDAKLRELAADSSLKIAACYPRAVKWLFAAGNACLEHAYADGRPSGHRADRRTVRDDSRERQDAREVARGTGQRRRERQTVEAMVPGHRLHALH